MQVQLHACIGADPMSGADAFIWRSARRVCRLIALCSALAFVCSESGVAFDFRSLGMSH